MSQRRSVRPKRRVHESGQAVVEFAMIATLLLILLCASIDFGRALNYVQGLIELTRQGSRRASEAAPTLQPAAGPTIQSGQTLYVTEVYYSFAPITPIGKLAPIVMPS